MLASIRVIHKGVCQALILLNTRFYFTRLFDTAESSHNFVKPYDCPRCQKTVAISVAWLKQVRKMAEKRTMANIIAAVVFSAISP